MTFLKRRAAIIAVLLLAAGCAEREAPLAVDSDRPPAPALARLTCNANVATGRLRCDSPSGIAAGGSARLIVGGQHQFVRMANTAPVLSGDTFRAPVTVQNLTQQPMATDGTTPDADGVVVFFVQAPNNGVEIVNHDGAAAYTESTPQKYFAYNGALLGDDNVLSSGEVSLSKTWDFVLNGATEFQFAVLVAATVPDESAYGIHLTRIAVGYHACGDATDGNVYCWGENGFGQLGDGTTTSRRVVPVRVIAPAGVQLSGVVTGYMHSCASGSDGKTYCWGRNTEGQLGHNSTTSSSPTPVKVSTPTGVRFSNLTSHFSHTCAEGDNGRAYCWGYNGHGRLGNGSTTISRTPVTVRAPAGVTLTGLAAGESHTCANGSDGKVYCWGLGVYGQLGNGTTASQSTVPKVTTPPTGVTLSNVRAGGEFNCATGSDTNIYCWGSNSSGQVGDGSSTERLDRPTRVNVPVGVTLSGLTLGGDYVCAFGSDAKQYCWGANSVSQYGSGNTTAYTAPFGFTPAIGGITSLAAGGYFTCGLTAGSAYCWGWNSGGQLGDGTTTNRSTPVRVASTR